MSSWAFQESALRPLFCPGKDAANRPSSTATPNLLHCYRHIELDPLHARMCIAPTDYPQRMVSKEWCQGQFEHACGRLNLSLTPFFAEIVPDTFLDTFFALGEVTLTPSWQYPLQTVPQ